MEILKARNGKSLDIVFACCGGGGLVAGVAAYIKQVRPDVKVTRGLRKGRTCVGMGMGMGMLFCDAWYCCCSYVT